MTQTMNGAVEALRAGVSATVLLPNDGAYDDARRVWNAEIDLRPAVIVQCRSAADVSAAVTFASAART